jgi:hypothetical protein
VVEHEGVDAHVIDLQIGRGKVRRLALATTGRRSVAAGMRVEGLAESRKALHDPVVQQKTCCRWKDVWGVSQS